MYTLFTNHCASCLTLLLHPPLCPSLQTPINIFKLHFILMIDHWG